jgi:DNA-binding transcriptional regulator YiaG
MLFVGGAAMTTEVKQFLIDRDMRTVEFAWLFNISHRTVIYWSMGHKEPPFSAIALIRAIQSGALDIDWLKAESVREKSLSGN